MLDRAAVAFIPLALAAALFGATVAPCARAADQAGQASIDALKQAHRDQPSDGRVARDLARAYLEGGNRVWARKVLLAQLGAAPDDLETRGWVLWLLIQDGALAQARELLEAAEPPADGPLAERFVLLEAALLQLEEEAEAARQRFEAMEERDAPLYPEDVGLFDELRARLVGPRGDPIQTRALLSGGYTTNATQSAPQEAGAGMDEAGAPVTALDLVLRVEPWTAPLARPVGELRAKGFLPVTDETRGLSYLNLGGRAGIEIGRAGELRGRLLYSYDLLGIMEQGWFMTAHRGELELDALPQLQLFAGVGRRIYEHLPRTRTELDAGAALVQPLPGGWNITGILAARLQLARLDAYDDRGLTGLVRVRVPLPREFMIKLRLMALYDVFPYSADYYETNRRRIDVMLKAEIGPWTPSFHGLRLGLTYTGARKFSTIATNRDNFNYADHRFLLQLRWQGSFDPGGPGAVAVSDDHQSLPYGFDEGGESGLDRVQDLIRQEDSARRGSMCVE